MARSKASVRISARPWAYASAAGSRRRRAGRPGPAARTRPAPAGLAQVAWGRAAAPPRRPRPLCSIRAAQRKALDGVGAQAETQGLQGEAVAGGDVAEVAPGAEVLQQPHLLSLQRRVEDQLLRIDRVDDLLDQAGTGFAVGAVDAGGARLARLGDHLPGTGVQVAFDLLHPDVGGHDEVDVLATYLGEDGELA